MMAMVSVSYSHWSSDHPTLSNVENNNYAQLDAQYKRALNILLPCRQSTDYDITFTKLANEHSKSRKVHN